MKKHGLDGHIAAGDAARRRAEQMVAGRPGGTSYPTFPVSVPRHGRCPAFPTVHQEGPSAVGAEQPHCRRPPWSTRSPVALTRCRPVTREVGLTCASRVERDARLIRSSRVNREAAALTHHASIAKCA